MFNWKYFIGYSLLTEILHKDVIDNEEIETLDKYIYLGHLEESKGCFLNTRTGSMLREKFEGLVPFIINPRNLTDEDWRYIFGAEFDEYIEREENRIVLRSKFRSGAQVNSYSYSLGRIDNCNQCILDRMYEKHSHHKYFALLKQNIIKDVGDIYESL